MSRLTQRSPWLGAILAGLAIAASLGQGDAPAPAEPARLDWHGDAVPPAALARLGTIRFRHPRPGGSLCFAPDGRSLLVPGFRTRSVTFDAATGRVALPLSDSEKEHASRAVYSPDGALIASTDQEMIRLRDGRTGRYLAGLEGHNGDVRGLAFLPDGKRLISAAFDRTVRVWDAASSEELGRWEGATDFVAVAVSADGATAATVTFDEGLEARDIATGRRLWRSSTTLNPVWHLAYSPRDDGFVAADADTHVVHVLARNTGRELRRLAGHREPVRALAASPDGALLASLDNSGALICWDSEAGRPRFVVNGPAGDATAVAFSPDGKWLAAIGARGGGAVRFWDVATGEEWCPYPGHDATIYTVAISPAGDQVATGGDTAVRLWDARTGRPQATFDLGPGRIVLSVAYSPDGRLLAIGAYDGTVRVRDLARDREVFRGEGSAQRGAFARVWAVAFSPDGGRLAVGGEDGTVRLLDPATGREARRWRVAEDSAVTRVFFSADGRQLHAVSRYDLHVVDLRGDAPVVSLCRGDLSGWVALTPDGSLALCAEDHRVVVRSTSGGAVVRRIGTEADQVYCLALSPDGALLATGGWDHAVRLWEVATGQEIRVAAGHGSDVRTVAFSADGRLLVSGSADTTALAWDVGRLCGGGPVAPLAEDEFGQAWAALAGGDVSAAYRSAGRMTATGAAAVRFLREKLVPDIRSPGKIERLALRLGDDRFEDREAAFAELAAMPLVVGPLRAAARATGDVEVRQRLVTLAERAEKATAAGEDARWFRALRVLEQIGGAEAERLLGELAKGDQHDQRFLAARRAAERIRPRP